MNGQPRSFWLGKLGPEGGDSTMNVHVGGGAVIAAPLSFPTYFPNEPPYFPMWFHCVVRCYIGQRTAIAISGGHRRRRRRR